MQVEVGNAKRLLKSRFIMMDYFIRPKTIVCETQCKKQTQKTKQKERKKNVDGCNLDSQLHTGIASLLTGWEGHTIAAALAFFEYQNNIYFCLT